MARRSITWRKLKGIAESNGIEVLKAKGGERKFKGPSITDGSIHVMRIGHKCCQRGNSMVYIGYIKAFQRHFGKPDEELFG